MLDIERKATDAGRILTEMMKERSSNPSKKTNPYIGITHEIPDYFIDDPRFCEVWKNNKCSNGVHALDEVWDGEDHYLTCDVCNLIIYIDRIDKSWVEDD